MMLSDHLKVVLVNQGLKVILALRAMIQELKKNLTPVTVLLAKRNHTAVIDLSAKKNRIVATALLVLMKIVRKENLSAIKNHLAPALHSTIPAAKENHLAAIVLKAAENRMDPVLPVMTVLTENHTEPVLTMEKENHTATNQTVTGNHTEPVQMTEKENPTVTSHKVTENLSAPVLMTENGNRTVINHKATGNLTRPVLMTEIAGENGNHTVINLRATGKCILPVRMKEKENLLVINSRETENPSEVQKDQELTEAAHQKDLTISLSNPVQNRMTQIHLVPQDLVARTANGVRKKDLNQIIEVKNRQLLKRMMEPSV